VAAFKGGGERVWGERKEPVLLTLLLGLVCYDLI